MTLKRTDIGDDADPNPNKDQQYQQPELREEHIPGRSFGGVNIAADEDEQADARNSGPPDRGNRTDDVQYSDRAGAERDVHETDAGVRTNSARTGPDVERREEGDQTT